jgi:hypothetical protein
MGSCLINGLAQQRPQNKQGTTPGLPATLERLGDSATGSPDCTLGELGAWSSVALGGSTSQSDSRGEP